MDVIQTALVVVVVLEGLWIWRLQAQMARVGLTPSDCCKKAEEAHKAAQNLFEWINTYKKGAKEFKDCVQNQTGCNAGAEEPWPPSGPGNFPGA